MKDTGTESMRTIGSLTLCRSLLRAGLVDRFRVVVFPVITGSTGKDRIYDGTLTCRSTWSAIAPSTVGSSSSSTSRRFCLGHPVPAKTTPRNADR